MFARSCLTAAVIGCVASLSLGDSREWTDVTGKFRIQAEFMEVKDGKVRLKKHSGEIVAIAIEKLSDADREYVSQLQPVASQQTPGKGGGTQQAAASNNLKQIGRAMHNYHDATKAFPPAYKGDKNGKPLLSWRVLILPYLGRDDLYRQFHLDEPWDSEHNIQLVAQMPAVYRSPNSAMRVQGKTGCLTVRGEKTVFPGGKGIRITDVVDGTANTIMIVQVPDERAVTWTKPDDFEYDESNPIKGLVDTKSDGFQAAFVDGRVRLLPSSIDPKVLKALFTRNGGWAEGDALQYISRLEREEREALTRSRRSTAVTPNASAGRDEPDVPKLPKAGNRRNKEE